MPAQIKQIHIWLQDKKDKWEEPDLPGSTGKPRPGKLVVLEPEGTSPVQLKLQIARELQKWIPKIRSYYVVMVVERSDQTLGYRVVIPKTVVV